MPTEHMNATCFEEVPATAFRREERRVKVWRIGYADMLTILQLAAPRVETNGYHMLQLPKFPNLPDGCRIEAVDHCFMSRSFKVLVSHPSFDAVPDGAPAPDAEPELGRQWCVYEVTNSPYKLVESK